MFRKLSEKLNWRAVILGWVVAIVTGVAVNLVFEAAHVLLFGGEALSPENFTTAVVAIIGFLFVVVAVAVVSAIAVATAGIFLVEGGIPFLSVTLGFAGSALIASLALLLLNVLGGFFGGKLGEWETEPAGVPGARFRRK